MEVSYALASQCRWAAWAAAKAGAEVVQPDGAAAYLSELAKVPRAPEELSHSLADALARTRQAAGESWEEWRPVVEAVVELASHAAKSSPSSRPSTERQASAGKSGGNAFCALTRMATQFGLYWRHRCDPSSDRDTPQRCLAHALQAFHQAHWAQPPWRGTNLGGWFLLEPGPASPFFETCHAKIKEINGQSGKEEPSPAREAPQGLGDEWSLCAALRAAGGEELRRQLFDHHRAHHYTAETMRNIVQCGLNAVRLPFGYWVVQEPGAGEAYEGPCLEALDRAVALIEDVGALQLLLDLHGCPGGESGDRPCGRHDSSWSWERWRTDEAVKILAIVAARYCDKSCVTGIQVCNEPSERMPVGRLCDFYENAIEAVRGAGMSADKVAVVLPIFTHWRAPEVTDAWAERGNFMKYDNVVFDLHYYHNFSSIWNLLSHRQHVDVVACHALELKCLPHAMVGEWSTSRPGQFSEAEQADFARQQVLGYNHASHGWFFWNWHDHEFYTDWDMERGAFKTGRLPKPLGPSELQGFLRPEWEEDGRGGSSLPCRAPGMWPRLMGWASYAQQLWRVYG
ncbi:3-beta-glucanase 1) (Exo-1 [Durusdinium trenchii]|uniref:glucan 1,3-beta-glucosidase n=1 Tax=Durusdinium trenchii TaxID=1381693 RepID=A0ABP0S1J6_9DINO